MKNEETIYENENTVYDDTRVNESAAAAGAAEERAAENETAAPAPKKSSAWKTASVGAGTGILLGTVASFATHRAVADEKVPSEQDSVFESDDDSAQPAWADDEVSVATSVNDDMSFSEAFAAARAEVGPGGAFEWHGGVYGTYTADEWNAMSAEERAEYNDHFSWSNHTTTSSASSGASAAEPEAASVAEQDSASTDTGEGEDYAQNAEADDDVEAVSVDELDPAAEETADLSGGDAAGTDDVEVAVVDSNPEVEILGVTYDNDLGVNIGDMTVDGQDVVLVDVTDNGHFDYMMVDADGNGEISDNEVFDIADQGISVEEFANAATGGGDMYASNDSETDYINDGYDMA